MSRGLFAFFISAYLKVSFRYSKIIRSEAGLYHMLTDC